MPSDTPLWVNDPPRDLESRILILDQFADQINERSEIGATLREIFRECSKDYEEAVATLQRVEPQAFWKPSYEQALLLNAWIYGFNFPICFSSNRIGKTTAFAFNGILWMFPNNPQWKCFQRYTDHLTEKWKSLPRPPLTNILKLQRFYEEYPELQGNPYHLPDEPRKYRKISKGR
jgi:hypothetical protein